MLTCTESEEGLDKLMACVYYGRMYFIQFLLPLLTAAPGGGRVSSVLSPGNESKKFFPDNLSLRNSSSILDSMSHRIYMITFFLEGLADRNPGNLAVSHVYPGYVSTDLVEKSPLQALMKGVFRLIKPVTKPLLKLWEIPGLEVGERGMFIRSNMYPPRGMADSEEGIKKLGLIDGLVVGTASDETVGGGAYRVNCDNEILPSKPGYVEARKQGMKEKAWDHTMEVFKIVVDEGKKFTG
jgi:hypothetical protein